MSTVIIEMFSSGMKQPQSLGHKITCVIFFFVQNFVRFVQKLCVVCDADYSTVLITLLEGHLLTNICVYISLSFMLLWPAPSWGYKSLSQWNLHVLWKQVPDSQDVHGLWPSEASLGWVRGRGGVELRRDVAERVWVLTMPRLVVLHVLMMIMMMVVLL